MNINTLPANRFTMSLDFIAFGILSMFGTILIEIFGSIYIYKITSSYTITYTAIGLQMVVEAALTLTLPWLLRRSGPAGLLALSTPFRAAAFGLLLMPAPDLLAIGTASLLISISSTASEVPRGMLLAAMTTNTTRGFNLGLFEALRYISLATAPLIGGFAFEFGGFVTVAALSSALSFLAAVFAARVQADLGDVSVACTPRLGDRIEVPWRIRVLWWSTGVRYLGENSLYPLLVVSLYASTVKLGWIAAAAAVAGIAFGAFADRVRGEVLLMLPLVSLSVGWVMRAQPLSFNLALVAGLICAVGGKAAGILEKKISYDFGDAFGNSVDYIGRREREMLLARAVMLAPCVGLGLGPAAAVTVVAMSLFINIGLEVALRSSPGRRRSLTTRPDA